MMMTWPELLSKPYLLQLQIQLQVCAFSVLVGWLPCAWRSHQHAHVGRLEAELVGEQVHHAVNVIDAAAKLAGRSAATASGKFREAAHWHETLSTSDLYRPAAALAIDSAKFYRTRQVPAQRPILAHIR